MLPDFTCNRIYIIELQHVTDLSGRETLVRITGIYLMQIFEFLVLTLHFKLIPIHFFFSLSCQSIFSLHGICIWFFTFAASHYHFCLYTYEKESFCSFDMWYSLVKQEAWRWKLTEMSLHHMLLCLQHRMSHRDARFSSYLKSLFIIQWSILECSRLSLVFECPTTFVWKATLVVLPYLCKA